MFEESRGGGVAYVRRIGVKGGWRMFVDNSPESPAPVDKPQGEQSLRTLQKAPGTAFGGEVALG